MSKITALPVADVHTIIPCTGHSMPESALTQRDDMQQAREQLEEAEKQVEELTMWVKRCRNGLFEPQRVNQCGGYIEMTTITSKFTKERLIDWAVVAVAERGRDLKDAPESVEAAANLKLAEIALAALTAEPVRYLNKFSGTCVTLEQQSNAADDVAVYIPLYAAPPVPEECPAELPYAQVKAVADLFALCWQSGEVVTYTPDPEKATIWLNNYSGTCVQEYVKLERLQEALAGNSPVTPDGWKLAPEKAEEDMIAEGKIMASCMIETVGKIDVSLIYGAMLAAAPEKETGLCTK